MRPSIILTVIRGYTLMLNQPVKMIKIYSFFDVGAPLEHLSSEGLGSFQTFAHRAVQHRHGRPFLNSIVTVSLAKSPPISVVLIFKGLSKFKMLLRC